MRKTKWWASAVAAGILTVALTVMAWSGRTTAPPRAVQKESLPYRVLGVWEEHVAVFLPQSDTPERVLDTPLAVLPTEEQNRLREGIAVADVTAFYERLEDYGG